MKAMITAIDIPVDSVVLETQFVELTEQGLKAIGIDFNNANGQIGVATLQSGQFIPPGVPAGAHLSTRQFQAALYAQIQKGNGRIVSRPRISAQSGSTAKIITGDALPILTSIALSGVNGVSQQVQYVNVGVTLQIAPRVSLDGFVVEPRLRRRLERNRDQPGLSDDQSARSRDFSDRARRRFVRDRWPDARRDDQQQVQGSSARRHSACGRSLSQRADDPVENRALHHRHPAHRAPGRKPCGCRPVERCDLCADGNDHASDRS